MKKKDKKRTLLFTVVLGISLCVCLSITAAYVYNKSSMEYAQMEQVVLVNANKTNNVITKLLYKTQVLAALVVQNDGNVYDFERVAATILDDPAIKNVLIAPNGVVSAVYPLAGNEQVIGLNFFEEGKGNKEAIEARNTEQLVLGGPFDLVQGGQALVGRLPVYTQEAQGEKKFWGIVSVTLNYPQAFDGAELDQLQAQGFAFEIWRMSPDTNERQIIAQSSYSYPTNTRYVEKPISILNAEWQFRISPVKNWYQYPETWILGIGGLIVSFLAAFFAVNTYNLEIMKNELQALTFIDPLTGVLNRRGLLSLIDDLLSEAGCRFTLCYMDLNKFKFINDNFGHGVGDKVLQQFASTFSKYIGETHIFARIGGDEFVLIFKGTEDENVADAFLNNVKAELAKITVGGSDGAVAIDFSVGKAMYPSQHQSIDDLLRVADSNMYKNKNVMRDTAEV